MEATINTYKGAYYQALHDSSQGWAENQHDYFPFIEHFFLYSGRDGCLFSSL